MTGTRSAGRRRRAGGGLSGTIGWRSVGTAGKLTGGSVGYFRRGVTHASLEHVGKAPEKYLNIPPEKQLYTSTASEKLEKCLYTPCRRSIYTLLSIHPRFTLSAL